MERSGRINRSEWVANTALKSAANEVTQAPRKHYKRAPKKVAPWYLRLFRSFV